MWTVSKNNHFQLASSPSSSLLPLLLTSCILSSTPVSALISTRPPVKSSLNPSTMKVETPKMPTKWPIVGTLPDFLSRGGIDGLNEVHESMYKDFGDVYGLSIFGDDELVISDPRVYEEYVLKNEGRFPRGGAEIKNFIEYYEENGIEIASKSAKSGPEWKEWRRAVNKDMFVMWDTYLPSIAATAKASSNIAGDQVNSGKLRFEDFISRLAFDMFSTVLYGVSPNTVDTDNADPQDLKFVEQTQTAFKATGAVLSDPLAKVMGSELYNTFKTSMDFTFQFAGQRTVEYVDRAREEQKYEAKNLDTTESKCPIQTIKSAANKLNPSYIDRLVRNDELTRDEIGEIAGPLLMAGVDTTAFVMSWLYLNLATNPEAQTKLADELKNVLRGSDITTAEQLDKLPYLRACVRESHRLTPSAGLLAKKLHDDVDIIAENKKYHVKAGQKISLNLRAFPMDPKFVENPTEYKPERFLPDAIKARKGTPSEIIDHAYFEDPFGRGKRKCLGGNVAYAEIYASLARIVQDWEIKLKPGIEQNWKPKFTLMIKADPYPEMVLVPRKK